ncbi:UNVERIFIED_CONTAM: hypothetical protein GTU68_006882 [Idotea baltica]|nr:hypothetical protein [Idotea baltica]
MFEMQL